MSANINAMDAIIADNMSAVITTRQYLRILTVLFFPGLRIIGNVLRLAYKEFIMKCHRLNEVIELLHPVWQQHSDLNLMQVLKMLADEAGFEGELSDLTDDILIYHLKMRGSDASAEIPGLKKDYEDDFKTALLRARGIIKE